MSEHDVLDHAKLDVQVAGGLDEADREHLTEEQIALIEEVDDQVTSWLREAPERQKQFLEHPTEALTSALGQRPSAQLEKLVAGTHEQEDTLNRVAEVARWGEPAPQPLSTAAFKSPRADNDVTFMLSLDALADAFQNAISRPLQEALPSRVWQSLQDVPVSLGVEPMSSRPALRLIDERVYLVMGFRGRLKVDVHGHELGLDDIFMTVPLTVEASPGSLAVRPEADEAQFGSPLADDEEQEDDDQTESEGDEPTATDLLDDDFFEKVVNGAVDVLPGLDEAVGTLPAEVVDLLDKDTLEKVRKAVTSWLSDHLLKPQIHPEPVLVLLTGLAPHKLVCNQLELTDLQAGFLPGDVPALAIGMGYGEDVELPDRSLIEHGSDSWVELSNRLLLKVVCCLVPQAFIELEKEPDHRTDSSCRWEGQSFLDQEGRRWEAEHVEVSCTDSLVLTARTTTTKPGIRITATLRLTFDLADDGSGLTFDPEIDVVVSLKWWVRIVIAVVVAVIVGLLLSVGLTPDLAIAGGAAAGILVALIVEGVVKLLKDEGPPDVLQALEEPLRFIPPQLTELLGDPVAETAVWDDLELLGKMVLRLVTVLDLVGKSEIEAREILGVHGFAIPAIERRHDEADKGTVIGQDPQAGEKMPVDAKVTLTVSKGKRVVGPRARVPDVVGKQDLEARRVLRKAGFKAMPKSVDSEKPHLEVVGQSPASGTKQPRGTTVTISVSKGPRRDPGDEDGEHHPPQPL